MYTQKEQRNFLALPEILGRSTNAKDVYHKILLQIEKSDMLSWSYEEACTFWYTKLKGTNVHSPYM